MKIYTEVIFEWKNNKLVEVSSESQDYFGPVAQCGGGGDEDTRDYTAERAILDEQKAATEARIPEIRKYFSQLEGFAATDATRTAEAYSLGKESRVGDFLTESYGIDKKRDIINRSSGFESDTAVTFDNKMEDDNRNRVFNQLEKSASLDFKTKQDEFTKSKFEREKAYEDQMDQIEDSLYSIRSAYAATE